MESKEYLSGKAEGLRVAAYWLREWSSWGTQSIGTMFENLHSKAVEAEQQSKETYATELLEDK